MRKSHNHIKRRYYLQGDLALESPLIIGSGKDDRADIECLRDWHGNPFIPGTTLAGVLRHYLSEAKCPGVDQCFGEHKDDGAHSLLVLQDAPALGTEKVSSEIRDGIKLDSLKKTVIDKKKYDYEVLHPGQKFRFRLEAVQRDKGVPELDGLLAAVKLVLENGDVRLGAKTNRGFGCVRLANASTAVFGMPGDAQAWLDFKWDQFNGKWPEASVTLQSPYDFEMHARFEVADSLLIRRYGVDPSDPDATTMQDGNNNAVIPGTAWNGAIRHVLENAGRELDCESKMTDLLKELFGDVVDDDEKPSDAAKRTSVRADEKQSAKRSRVRIDETVVKKGQLMTYVRNKIDRFTGGVVNSALFDERPVFGGITELKVAVRKCSAYEAGLLLLALQELQNGIQTVGGGANIGRGRLMEGPVKIKYKGAAIQPGNYQEYFDALAVELQKEDENHE
jgi:CRISPR/Cas system CSM-associated protein Csm3 (group 7 of RAMP superfamily)